MKATLVLMLAAILGTSIRPQQPSRDQDQPLKLNADLVTVSAAVTDTAGRTIRSLKAEDFKVYEDGVQQRIARFARSEAPFTLMMLLDLSGSTADDIMLIKRAAKSFLSELRGGDKAGVIVFSGEVELISEFSDDANKAIDRVATPRGAEGSRFTENTGTSFYDALFLAVEESPLKQVEGRKAIVCMSDGVDSSSKMKYDEVARLVEKSDASVYFLELNTEALTLDRLLKPKSDADYANLSQSQVERYFDAYDKDSFDRHRDRRTLPPDLLRRLNHGLFELARREQRDLSGRTGGRVYEARSLIDLEGVYRQVADDLRSQYLIEYYTTNNAHDGRWRSIRVEAHPANGPRPANVRARSGYWAK